MNCPVCTLPMKRTEKDDIAIYECSCGERYEIPIYRREKEAGGRKPRTREVENCGT